MSARHDRFGRSHSHHSGYPVDVAAYDESRSLQCQVYERGLYGAQEIDDVRAFLDRIVNRLAPVLPNLRERSDGPFSQLGSRDTEPAGFLEIYDTYDVDPNDPGDLTLYHCLHPKKRELTGRFMPFLLKLAWWGAGET